jgi:hypothetical protein
MQLDAGASAHDGAYPSLSSFHPMKTVLRLLLLLLTLLVARALMAVAAHAATSCAPVNADTDLDRPLLDGVVLG